MIARSRNRLVLICCLAVFSQSLTADSFRCGRKLVSVGDSARGLAKACGNPDHKDRGKETIRVDGVVKKVSVERWYYKKSPRALERIIIVHQGRVAAMKLGRR